jgi:hypothetical protein
MRTDSAYHVQKPCTRHKGLSIYHVLSKIGMSPGIDLEVKTGSIARRPKRRPWAIDPHREIALRERIRDIIGGISRRSTIQTCQVDLIDSENNEVPNRTGKRERLGVNV